MAFGQTHTKEVNTMRINYNVTGAQRKELVKIISDTTGARAEYKFMPTCNYEIGFFTVTKDGATSRFYRVDPLYTAPP